MPELRGVHRLVTDDEAGDLDELAERWIDPGARPDTLAFLQYTSGSTAAPKGVMITHGNLLHNSALIQASFGSSPESRGVFWLPLFHDMGLIGGVIQTLYCGGSSTLFSPVSFLQRPIRWLQAISRTGATISGAPNFAYDLCVEKTTPEQRAGLDLSCWRVAFNGAEPIRPETLDRFADAFAPAGFRREAFLPCYGLAEATLLVSGGPRAGRPSSSRSTPRPSGAARSSRPAPSRAGQAAGRQRQRRRRPSRRRSSIPRPASRAAEDRVGEIWVSGPSVAQGYWGRPAETEERPPRDARRRRGAVPPDRRPGLPQGWRALRHRPAQGHDHPPRPKHLSAGHRVDGGTVPPGALRRRRRGLRGRDRRARSGWRSSRRSSGIAIRGWSTRSSRRSAARSPSSTTSRSTRSG